MAMLAAFICTFVLIATQVGKHNNLKFVFMYSLIVCGVGVAMAPLIDLLLFCLCG